MKAIKFKEQNIVYADNQPEYIPLPAYNSYNSDGVIISCWKGNVVERIIFLFTGKIWMSLMMFNNPLLTPSRLAMTKPEMDKKKKE